MKYLSLFLCLFSAVLAAKQPNVVLILCDDFGYGDLAIHGHPYVKSPNIDKLARDGMRFENGYQSGAWCSPSRAALHTGLYPARYFNVTHEIKVDQPTLPRTLKEAGYTTAHFGKWHMSGKTKDSPKVLDYGLDEAFITAGNGPTWEKGANKTAHYREHTTPHYVNLGIDFMRRHQDKPFYVNLCLYPTHSYIDPTEEQLAVYKDLKVDIMDFENPLQREFLNYVAKNGDIQEAMRAYCADVTALDHEIGRLLAAIDELKLTENTIVIFTSDNGPGPNKLEGLEPRYKQKPQLLNSVGSAGPFRDRKSFLHDGGIHVPLFVRWPAVIKAGSLNSKTLFAGVDYLPTLATIAGAPVPDGLDGEDLSEAFQGAETTRQAPLYWSDKPGWWAMRDGKWKAHLEKGEFSLFDLTTDLSESTNLAQVFPEVADTYHKKLKAWKNSIPKPPKRERGGKSKKKKAE